MKTRNVFRVIFIVVTIWSCGNKNGVNSQYDDSDVVEYYTNAPGDSTLYGLACDGCTDSVVVVLPYTGGDPDTFDIIRAVHGNRIYGKPHIGKRLALTINPNNRKEAMQVLVLNDLEQQWCFTVMPKIIGEQPDSIVKRLLFPHEYCYVLKRDGQMRTVGQIHQTGTSDEKLPVEYPDIKPYNKWSVFNGKLIMAFDIQNALTAKNDTLKTDMNNIADTAEIVMLKPDTLVLRIKNIKREFYRAIRQ